MVQSPDGTELWQLYNGKFDCTTSTNSSYDSTQPAGPFNEPTQLTSPNNRVIRLQLITFDPGAQTTANPTGGAPILGSPWGGRRVAQSTEWGSERAGKCVSCACGGHDHAEF